MDTSDALKQIFSNLSRGAAIAEILLTEHIKERAERTGQNEEEIRQMYEQEIAKLRESWIIDLSSLDS